MTDDPFLLTLLPTTHDLGGFKVHRTLPHRQRTTVGPFIFFDQMGPAHLAPGTGIDVPPHPHINPAPRPSLPARAPPPPPPARAPPAPRAPPPRRGRGPAR